MCFIIKVFIKQADNLTVQYARTSVASPSPQIRHCKHDSLLLLSSVV